MSLDFITSDPATDAYQTGTAFQNQQRDYQEKKSVDAAVRRGLAASLDQQSQQQAQPAPASPGTLGNVDTMTPMKATLTSPVSDTTTAPTAATPDPGPSATSVFNAVPAMTPPVAPTAPPGVPPDSLATKVKSVEVGSGPSTTVNAGGYSGNYQFGKAALAAAGAYARSPGEDLNDNHNWSGTITLPGRAPMTYQQFLSDQTAQDQAWGMHVSNLDRETAARGLTKFIGTTVGGVPVTEDSIRAMMQIGGPAGTQRFLESGGAINPADANGTTISAYAAKVMGKTGGPPSAGAADQVSPADANAAASNVSLGLGGTATLPTAGNRYNPILAELAQTPGGGATALALMGQQVRQDTATLNRQTQYQRLAMQALGRGDTDVFKYYAQLGGLNVPPQILQNAGATKRLATVSLLAERFYRDDPAAAQKLTAAYLQTGDINQAFAVAGPPANNPRLSVQWLRQGEQEIALTFNPRTGQMAPVQDGTGAPVSRDVRPSAAQQHVQWVTQPDGSSKAFQVVNGQMVPVAGPDGQQMVAAPKAVGSARVADRTVRLSMLKAAGIDDQTANMIAGGATVSPNTVATVYARIRSGMERNAMTDQDRANVEGRANDQMTVMFGPNWQRMTQAPATAPAATIGPNAVPPPAPVQSLPPATPAPAPVPTAVQPLAATPSQAPAPAPPSPPAPSGIPVRPTTVPPGAVWSPSRRMYRDQQGRLYDEQGNPIQQPGAGS